MVSNVHAIETAVDKQGASSDKISSPASRVSVVGNDQLDLLSMRQGASNRQNNDDEWQIVQRKRYRNRFVGEKGTCTTTDGKFKAANSRKIPLFINNVHKETDLEDIASYIRNRTGIEVTLYLIKSKQQRDYNSFKMFVPEHKSTLFLDPNLWPDGITFRRFVEFRKRETDDKKIGMVGFQKKQING